jgi:hypothetical protein
MWRECSLVSCMEKYKSTVESCTLRRSTESGILKRQEPYTAKSLQRHSGIVRMPHFGFGYGENPSSSVPGS